MLYYAFLILYFYLNNYNNNISIFLLLFCTWTWSYILCVHCVFVCVSTNGLCLMPRLGDLIFALDNNFNCMYLAECLFILTKKKLVKLSLV